VKAVRTAEDLTALRPNGVARPMKLNHYGIRTAAEMAAGFARGAFPSHGQFHALCYVWLLNLGMGEQLLTHDRRNFCRAQGHVVPVLGHGRAGGHASRCAASSRTSTCGPPSSEVFACPTLGLRQTPLRGGHKVGRVGAFTGGAVSEIQPDLPALWGGHRVGSIAHANPTRYDHQRSLFRDATAVPVETSVRKRGEPDTIKITMVLGSNPATALSLLASL
jgi:hypothetical protein